MFCGEFRTVVSESLGNTTCLDTSSAVYSKQSQVSVMGFTNETWEAIPKARCEDFRASIAAEWIILGEIRDLCV